MAGGESDEGSEEDEPNHRVAALLAMTGGRAGALAASGHRDGIGEGRTCDWMGDKWSKRSEVRRFGVPPLLGARHHPLI